MNRIRMVFSLLLLCLITPSIPSVAQVENDEADSLKKLLTTTPKGSAKLELYGKICWAYLTTRTQLDLAKSYADSLNLIARELGDNNGIAKAQYYYGVLARHRGEFDRAIDHLNHYVAHYENLGDSVRVAYGLFQLAAVNTTMGNYDKSLGTLYRILHIYESDSSYFDIGYTLNGIGVIYKNMKKYDDAIKIYKKALAIYDTLDSEQDKAVLLGNIANVYADTHRFEDARSYYEQALRIDQAIGSEWGMAYDLENIGGMLSEMKYYDSALVYQLKALAIREKTRQKNEIAISYKQVGYSYFLLKNYPAAERYLAEGLSLAKELNSNSLMRDFYDVLADLYAGKKNYSKAYKYHQFYAAMKDSVLNEQTARQLNELQTKYETAEKDKQILLLAQEKELQTKEAQRQAVLKKAFFGGFLLITLLAISIIFIVSQRHKNQQLLAAKNEEIKEATFKQQLVELEMKALRAQINPHFLFNCMNSINVMIMEGEAESASRYLSKFSALVRMILENSEKNLVALDKELAMIESYIQLEELRFKEKIDVGITIDDHIAPEETYLPPLILQPVVENAIWHGLMHKESRKEGKINIVIREENDSLCCTIEDNGVGRKKAELLRESSVWKSKSMGLKITEDRLRLLSNKKLRDLIQITDLYDQGQTPTGTRVDISISLV